MKKSIHNLISKFGSDSTGFINIKGGATSLAHELSSNQSYCNNSGTCTGTNDSNCTNSKDCTKATNKGSGSASCTNSNTCFF